MHKVKVEGITAGSSMLAILKLKLVGEAANMIASVALTDANFAPTWAHLIKRYENKSDLIHSHIEEFDKFQNLTTESGRGLRSLLDLINNVTTSLQNIGVTMTDSGFDVLMVYYAVKKLDSKTKSWWALANKSDISTVKELTEFLEHRAKALFESASTSSQHTLSKSSDKSSSNGHKKVHHVSTPKCVQCSESHFIWTCPDFKALTVQGRWDVARAKNLCFNCLG